MITGILIGSLIASILSKFCGPAPWDVIVLFSLLVAVSSYFEV